MFSLSLDVYLPKRHKKVEFPIMIDTDYIRRYIDGVF